MLFDAGKGLFVQSPILMLAVPGAVLHYRQGHRALTLLAIANIAVYSAAISAMDAWGGGATTSMRYMIVTLPFFCLLLPDVRTWWALALFLPLFVFSAANMYVLAATSTMHPHDYPLSQAAYPSFLQGHVAINPVLTSLGVDSAVPAIIVTVVYTLALGSLLRRGLSAAR